MRKESEKYREEMNEKLSEERSKEAQKIEVDEGAEKSGHLLRQSKEEQRPWKTYEEVARKENLGLAIHHIDEIRNALDQAQSLEKTPTPLNLGLMRTFRLWSFDHIKHYDCELAPTMYIKFSSKFDRGKFNEEQIRTQRAKKLFGRIHLFSNIVFDLGNFTPPGYCSTKTHNLGTSQEPVYIQFFNDNYLTLKIRRETVLEMPDYPEDDIPYNAPSLLTYYGISETCMVDKAKQEGEQWETEEESVIE